MEMEAELDPVELSEGELVEEDSTNGGERVADKEEFAEPTAKKQKTEKESSDQDEGGWSSSLTPRQLKRKEKKRKREQKKHQAIENKLASLVTHTSDSNLHARQTDVIKSLVHMSRGLQRNCDMVQKLKTIQFQSVISHLLVGSPPLGMELAGVEELRSEYRVVVIWLSMISSDFLRSYPDHFPKLKKLSPCVMFDIEHPGSSRFVKFGLESFMMVTPSEDNPTPLSVFGAQIIDPDARPPTRQNYLFTQDELSDNNFPNPLKGAVDPLGHHVEGYTSVVEWPSCEIEDTPQVTASREGKEEMQMFAIDCEMVETGKGSELARISIIDEEHECLFDTFVKPECPVTDYRTKYSGIDESTLEGVSTTLEDVQEKLVTLLPSNCILIGHSLENDFHAMKFRHPFVIDTSCLFTPLATPTAKPGLRRLSKELLEKDIQNTDKGHNSIEDATTCMKLVQLKLEKGPSCKIPFNEITPSIFTEYRTRGCTTGIIDKDSVVRLYGKGSSFLAEAKTDEEAVSKSIEIIPQAKFTFVQLHSMEYLTKSEGGGEKGRILEVAEAMDSHVIQLVENIPQKSMVFIVCGSSDIKKVRSLQQQEHPDYHQLRKQVMKARTGCVIGLVLN